MLRVLFIIIAVSQLIFSADLVIEINGKADPALDKKIRAALDLVHADRFSEALRVFEGIKKQYPSHPAGYFFTAATIDAKMAFYMSAGEEKEFTANCEKAIELGEAAMQSNPDDMWNLFFTGGSYGTLGSFQGRYKRYITSFRNGLSGVDLLKQVYKRDPRFSDALFGMGVYTYWSSKLSKLLWWMPGVGDNREEGIQQLKKAANDGIYAAVPAVINLAQVLNLEGRYDEALKVTQEWLVKYPDNRALSFYAGEAHAAKGELDKALAIFEEILAYADAEDRNNNVHSLKCHASIAAIYEKKKNNLFALAHCKRGLMYGFKEPDLQITKEYSDQLRAISARVKAKAYPSR
ncbi:MAG: tetratricopeptide repeat protein [Fibrobacteres bacterium]|nr:tetratricopeptide repeat protein [Fibrobacterota bacterium]